MKFEIREFTGATVSAARGETERSLGETSNILASFEAAFPGAARTAAIKILGDLGINSANYVDVVEPVCCTWFVTDSRLIALVVA